MIVVIFFSFNIGHKLTVSGPHFFADSFCLKTCDIRFSWSQTFHSTHSFVDGSSNSTKNVIISTFSPYISDWCMRAEYAHTLAHTARNFARDARFGNGPNLFCYLWLLNGPAAATFIFISFVISHNLIILFNDTEIRARA